MWYTGILIYIPAGYQFHETVNFEIKKITTNNFQLTVVDKTAMKFYVYDFKCKVTPPPLTLNFTFLNTELNKQATYRRKSVGCFFFKLTVEHNRAMVSL